nr:AlNc14C13G1595 [Albugo laibachii Nc14]CCA16259.1 AlNc14C20G2038 [Albugo laibachii Nc14]|eukprot:CCA16259.1 AlNc14C20G2038 [Albugo laibachii Nc14]
MSPRDICTKVLHNKRGDWDFSQYDTLRRPHTPLAMLKSCNAMEIVIFKYSSYQKLWDVVKCFVWCQRAWNKDIVAPIVAGAIILLAWLYQKPKRRISYIVNPHRKKLLQT